MTDDPIGTEANRAAHRLSRSSIAYLKLESEWPDLPVGALSVARRKLIAHARAYEEIDRRAQREATA